MTRTRGSRVRDIIEDEVYAERSEASPVRLDNPWQSAPKILRFAQDRFKRQGRETSSRSVPSGPTRRTRMAISPAACVEQLRQGSYARTTAETRLSIPSVSFVPS